MKNIFTNLKIAAICLFLSSSAWGQGGTDCAIVVSSTISLSSKSGTNCTYSFTPTVTINDKPKLIQFAFTVGEAPNETTLYACYNYNGTSVVLLGVQSTECGSDNAFFPKGSTITFPAATFTLPCGAGSIAFTAYNGAAGGKPTGECANAPVTVSPNPLPVKLVAFEGEASNEGVLLKWETVEEVNSDKFVVQRSHNAKEFDDLAEVKSAGTTNETTEYSYMDYTASNGTNYYRLKQQDNDGSVDFSTIISVKRTEQEKAISVFPNPSTEARITLQGTEGNVLSARLTSMNGDVHELMPSQRNDVLELMIPTSAKNGLYILHIQTAEKTITRKIIIE